MTDPAVSETQSTHTQAGEVSPIEDEGPERSLWGDALHDLIRNPMFVIPLLVILTIASMAALPWLWTSIDPTHCPLLHAKSGPAPGHPFGFTVFGCDMFAQVIYGAQKDMIIAVVCTVGITVIGVTLGSISAYFGGWLDVVLSRLTDVFFGLPFVLAALLILSVMGAHSVWSISLVLIIFGWTQMFRIMRGSVLSTMHADYVEAAKALGSTNLRIIVRHILPNSIAPAIVLATIALGTFVSAEATLTFLGIGLVPPAISWGVLITQGQNWAVTGLWHLEVYPCAFLVATVLSFILLGDALRDAIDPKLR